METKNILIFIADISGYTKYMLANQTAIQHASINIKTLLDTLIQELELPIIINKIAGDSILMYAEIESLQNLWGTKYQKKIGDKLLKLSGVFKKQLQVMISENICNCNACVHLNTLKLKILVHKGEVFFHTINHICEISGIPLIIIHRLLKNSVGHNEYILVTKEALENISIQTPLYKVKEEIYDVGIIKYQVYTV